MMMTNILLIFCAVFILAIFGKLAQIFEWAKACRAEDKEAQEVLRQQVRQYTETAVRTALEQALQPQKTKGH